MIDITQYRLLTPALCTLNVDKELTLYKRNGDIELYTEDTSTKIDLHEYKGAQNEDFNLVFTNRSKEFIKRCQRSEAVLQALYAIFNFETNGGWVECSQYDRLEFLDAMYLEVEPIEETEEFLMEREKGIEIKI